MGGIAPLREATAPKSEGGLLPELPLASGTGCGINRYKKSPSCLCSHEGLHPAYFTLYGGHLPQLPWGWLMFKAGLLTVGSLYSPRLPAS